MTDSTKDYSKKTLKSLISEFSTSIVEDVQQAREKNQDNIEADTTPDSELKEQIETLLWLSYENFAEGFSCFEKYDKSKKSEKILDKLSKSESKPQETFGNIDISDKEYLYLFKVATKILNKGKYIEAKAMFSLLCNFKMLCLPIWLALGSVETLLHNYEEAQRHHKIATELFPQQIQPHLHACISHALGDKKEEAKLYLEKARELAEKSDSPNEQLKEIKKIETLYLQDDLEQAAEAIAEQIVSDQIPTAF